MQERTSSKEQFSLQLPRHENPPSLRHLQVLKVYKPWPGYWHRAKGTMDSMHMAFEKQHQMLQRPARRQNAIAGNAEHAQQEPPLASNGLDLMVRSALQAAEQPGGGPGPQLPPTQAAQQCEVQPRRWTPPAAAAGDLADEAPPTGCDPDAIKVGLTACLPLLGASKIVGRGGVVPS